jgi:hypothetical protein
LDEDRDAEKPWAGNRIGDPRQLLHEAKNLEVMVAVRRREVKRLRAIADEDERGAERMEEAARDYRAWASERGVT